MSSPTSPPMVPRLPKRYLPATLAQTPWIFWGLMAGWAFWNLTSDICTSKYPELMVPLLTVTVCGAFWAAHVAAIKGPVVSKARFLFETLGGGFLNLLFMLVVSLVFTFLPPAFASQCYTDRARVSEVILAMSSVKTDISERAAAGKVTSLAGIGNGFKLEAGGRLKEGWVSPDGRIVGISDSPVAIVILTPGIVNGGIKWECKGYPEKNMPASCR